MKPHRRIARRVRCACVAGAICLFVTGAVVGGRAHAQATTRVSVATGSRQSSGEAWLSALSGDGRYVAFESDAADLVAGDTNGVADVFVHDRQTRVTARVSVSTGGAQGSAASMEPSLSADGRFVAFSSYAHDLVPYDLNGVSDIFVRDRQSATTTRVSVATGGTEATGHSYSPAISADGRHVSFWSAASNLVADDTNAGWDLFVHDRATATTTRVSVATGGVQGSGDMVSWWPSPLSADGVFVVYTSEAADLVPEDTNEVSDVFLHDRQTWVTTRLSVNASGAQGTDGSGCPSISADGRYVVFSSAAPNLVPGDTNDSPDAFLHDRLLGTTSRVSGRPDGSPAAGTSIFAVISADGSHVAFASMASLVPGDLNHTFDVFVHDRLARVTARVSIGSGATAETGMSFFPVLSADGRFIAYASEAGNLVADDTNEKADVFVHDLHARAETFLRADLTAARALVRSRVRGMVVIHAPRLVPPKPPAMYAGVADVSDRGGRRASYVRAPANTTKRRTRARVPMTLAARPAAVHGCPRHEGQAPRAHRRG